MSAGGGAYTGETPECRVIQPIQGGQISLELGWCGLRGWLACHLQGAKQDSVQTLPSGLGRLLQSHVQAFGKLHRDGSGDHLTFLAPLMLGPNNQPYNDKRMILGSLQQGNTRCGTRGRSCEAPFEHRVR